MVHDRHTEPSNDHPKGWFLLLSYNDLMNDDELLDLVDKMTML